MILITTPGFRLFDALKQLPKVVRMAMGPTVFRIRIELNFRWCWNLVTPSRSCEGSPPNGLVGASCRHLTASKAKPLPAAFRESPRASLRRGRKFKFLESEYRNRFAFVAKEKSRVRLDRRASNLAGVANPTSHDHQQVRSQCSKWLTHCACAGSNSRQSICRHGRFGGI